jgi:hypothetical protein
MNLDAQKTTQEGNFVITGNIVIAVLDKKK